MEIAAEILDDDNIGVQISNSSGITTLNSFSLCSSWTALIEAINVEGLRGLRWQDFVSAESIDKVTLKAVRNKCQVIVVEHR